MPLPNHYDVKNNYRIIENPIIIDIIDIKSGSRGAARAAKSLR